MSLYESGKYLGTVRVDGNMNVSGQNSNGWIHLSGSGYVYGDITVDGPEP